MPQRFFWTAACIAFCSAVLGGTAWIVLEDRRAVEAHARVETESMARLLVAQAQDSLVHIQGTIEYAASLLGRLRTGALQAADVTDQLKGLVTASPAIGTIWAVREDGSAWIDNFTATPSGAPVTHRRYFQVHQQGQSQFVGPVEVGTLRPRPRMTVSVRLERPDGGFGGVLVAGVDASHFLQLFDSARGGSFDLSATLQSDTGELLVASGVRASAGRGELMTSYRLDPPGINLVVNRDMTSVLEAWRGRAWLYACAAVLVCFGFIVLAYLGMRTAVREAQTRTELNALAASLHTRVEQARGEVELLLLELRHRVKNNLAVVRSLLNQQRRSSRSEEVRSALSIAAGRVDVIASLYDVLDPVAAADLDGSTLVRRVLDSVIGAVQTPKDRVIVERDLQPVQITPEQYVPLGLFVNEVLTNAFKHISLDGPSPTIRITLQPDEQGFRFSVSNPSGNAINDFHETRGAQLLDALARQVSGTIHRSAGEKFCLTLRVQHSKRPILPRQNGAAQATGNKTAFGELQQPIALPLADHARAAAAIVERPTP